MMRYFAVAVSLIACGCSQPATKQGIAPQADSVSMNDTVVKQADPCTVASAWEERVILKSLKGDFNGDGKKEMLFEKLYSRRKKAEITTLVQHPDYECFVQSVISLQPILYMIPDQKGMDTLRLSHEKNMQVLGIAKILNLGDVTGNGSDEIAMVVNAADHSVHGSMRIYSYDGGSWKLIHCFSVHETSLDSVNKKIAGIPGVLEKRQGKWYYMDYLEMEYTSADEVGRLQPLVIKGCE